MRYVQLSYVGKNKKVRNAVDKANEILCSDDFYRQIKAYRDFNQSCLSPEIIVNLMRESAHTVVVRVNWLAPSSCEYDCIRISGWDFSSNLAGSVNLLVYETVRAIGLYHQRVHQNEHSRYDDKYTAPWVIGTIAEIMVK